MAALPVRPERRPEYLWHGTSGVAARLILAEGLRGDECVRLADTVEFASRSARAQDFGVIFRLRVREWLAAGGELRRFRGRHMAVQTIAPEWLDAGHLEASGRTRVWKQLARLEDLWPEYLWHGTSKEAARLILAEGLRLLPPRKFLFLGQLHVARWYADARKGVVLRVRVRDWVLKGGGSLLRGPQHFVSRLPIPPQWVEFAEPGPPAPR